VSSNYRFLVFFLIIATFVFSYYQTIFKNKYILIVFSSLFSGTFFFLTGKDKKKEYQNIKEKILDIISSENKNNFKEKIREIKSEFGLSSDELKKK